MFEVVGGPHAQDEPSFVDGLQDQFTPVSWVPLDPPTHVLPRLIAAGVEDAVSCPSRADHIARSHGAYLLATGKGKFTFVRYTQSGRGFSRFS
jgi:hypothetical protein